MQSANSCEAMWSACACDMKARGWRRGRNEKVKNVDLWQQLDELRRAHELSTHWIRGHDDHPENERCDELAVAAAAQFAR